jgi:hypothetical protein
LDPDVIVGIFAHGIDPEGRVQKGKEKGMQMESFSRKVQKDGAVQCSAVRCGAVHCVAVRCDAVHCIVVQCTSAVHYDVILYDAVWK